MFVGTALLGGAFCAVRTARKNPEVKYVLAAAVAAFGTLASDSIGVRG